MSLIDLKGAVVTGTGRIEICQGTDCVSVIYLEKDGKTYSVSGLDAGLMWVSEENKTGD